MKKEYNAMFDKLAPQKSDEELLQAVLSGKADNMGERKKSKRKSKAIIIPAIAAALVLCTTVGVSAAYEWNLSAAISDIFNKSAKKAPDEVTFKEFNFETVGGKELNDVLKFDGFEVQFKGVSADPHNMILFYDVVLDDIDIKLKEAEQLGVYFYSGSTMEWTRDYYRREGVAGTEDDPFLPPPEEMDKKIRPGECGASGFLGMEGNVAHCYFRQYFQGYTCTGRTQNFEVGNLFVQRGSVPTDDGYYHEFIKETPREEFKDYEISFDFFDESDSLDFMTETEITLSNGVSGTITHVQLTPFNVCFAVCWGELPEEALEKRLPYEEFKALLPVSEDSIFDEFQIKFKDGTIMDSSAFLSYEDGVTRGFRWHSILWQDPEFHWLYPVNVSDIEVLIIGTTTVPIG